MLDRQGIQYIRQREDELFSPRCIASTLQGVGGSVKVQNVIIFNGQEPIVGLQSSINLAKFNDMFSKYFLSYFDLNLSTNHKLHVG